MEHTSNIVKTLAHELTSGGLIGKQDSVVVGVSGGPDSMALLNLLHVSNRQLGWHLKLHVAHLNHRLRGEESDADARFVQEAAHQLHLPCTIESREIATLAGKAKLGIEEAGRRERFAFFERICLRVGARIATLGHHADDNAETILHRILRGTGMRGLAGIQMVRPLSPGSEIRIVRPLLHFPRSELRQYLLENNISFREDRSNRASEPMRNRIRNVLLPLIEQQINPQAREALLRLADQAHWLQEFFAETIDRTLESLVVSRTDQQLVLNADALARKSRLMQAEIVRTAYSSFGLGEQELGFIHLAGVLELVADSAGGRKAQLPGGMIVEKRYHQLILSLPSEQPRETIAPNVMVRVPGVTNLSVRGLQIECQVREASSEEIARLKSQGSRHQENVDFDAVRLPLVVRSRAPGDRFMPLGAPGAKKISDFLADTRVDPRERTRINLLCDQLGPIWVIGHRIDDRVKLTPVTRRVLHLKASPLKS